MLCLALPPSLLLHCTHPSSVTMNHAEVLKNLLLTAPFALIPSPYPAPHCQARPDVFFSQRKPMLAGHHLNFSCSKYFTLLFPTPPHETLTPISIQNKHTYLMDLQICSIWAQHCHVAQRPLVWNVPSLSTSFQPDSLPKIPLKPMSNVISCKTFT